MGGRGAGRFALKGEHLGRRLQVSVRRRGGRMGGSVAGWAAEGPCSNTVLPGVSELLMGDASASLSTKKGAV